MDGYVPKLTPQRIETLRRWHEAASAELHRRDAHDIEYLGLKLHVPEHVFPPTPTSDLLGREVLAHVRPQQRVLDMGCGAGANALLAARVTDDVVAVDVNPHAVPQRRRTRNETALPHVFDAGSPTSSPMSFTTSVQPGVSCCSSGPAATSRTSTSSSSRRA